MLLYVRRRSLIRDVDGGEGAGAKGKRVSSPPAQLDPQKTEKAVDHRQNNNYVKAVGTSQLVYSAIAVSTAGRRRKTGHF